MNDAQFFKRGGRSAHLLMLAVMLAGCLTCRALEFEKLLAFTTADSVRIEVAPKGGGGL